jgi:hypothetical protein
MLCFHLVRDRCKPDGKAQQDELRKEAQCPDADQLPVQERGGDDDCDGGQADSCRTRRSITAME